MWWDVLKARHYAFHLINVFQHQIKADMYSYICVIACTCFLFVCRSICIFGVGDLQRLTAGYELFANKFHSDFQPMASHCLEKWFMEKTDSERVNGVQNLDVGYYRRLAEASPHT